LGGAIVGRSPLASDAVMGYAAGLLLACCWPNANADLSSVFNMFSSSFVIAFVLWRCALHSFDC
jgi:hypothetical protein